MIRRTKLRRGFAAAAATIVAAFAAAPAGAQDPLGELIDETCTTIEGTLCPCPECPASSFPATGKDRQVVAGEDGNPAFGALLAYQDNGDGTITDLNTGLVWEKKINLDATRVAGDLNDADNCYRWSGSCSDNGAECGTDADCSAGGTCDASDCQTASNGMTIFEWVAELNTQNFAGHNDWRVPNVKELQSVVDYGRVFPSIDPAFHGSSCGGGCTDLADPACSCTASSGYWSATSFESAPSAAWVVSFSSGSVGGQLKAGNVLRFVRAVRGGS